MLRSKNTAVSSVAWHDPRMEQGRGTAGLNHGMVENAIALRLRQCGVGHLVHADLQSAIRAVDKFGRLDVLHNNAGGSTAQDDTAVNAPLDEFWRAIKLDLYGTFLGCRFGIPELIKAGGGSVINMSSNVALMGVAGRDCYTAAKGGIAAITRSLAVAYAPRRRRP